MDTPPHPSSQSQSPRVSNEPSAQSMIALALGIASWLFGLSLIGAIPGFIIARKELADIKAGHSAQAGHGFAQAAYWVSLINIIVSVISIIIGIIMVLFWLLFIGGFLAFAGLSGA